MNRSTLSALLLVVSAPAICAPPPALHAALEKWASPKSISRYQFSLVDLNGDGTLDAVVQVTDPSFCGRGARSTGGGPRTLSELLPGGMERIPHGHRHTRRVFHVGRALPEGAHSAALVGAWWAMEEPR